METSLESVIITLEESLGNNISKLQHFNSYKEQLETHLKEVESTIDECLQEIKALNRIIQTFNET